MQSFIEKCLERHPEALVMSGGDSFTYGQLGDTAARHGRALSRALPRGAKCGVLCGRGINTAVGLLACWYADMTAIPLSYSYGRRHCEKILSLTCPDAVITDTGDMEYKCTYNLSDGSFSGLGEEVYPEEELCGAALIMCTSGTTGEPKGAVITKQGLRANAEAVAEYFRINEADTVCIARPLYHCAVLTGELLVSLIKGASIVFLDGGYDPAKIIQCISGQGITVLCGTPTLLSHVSRLISAGGRENRIGKIAVSGECLSESIAKGIRRAFPDCDIYSVYGLTEVSPRVSYLPPVDFDRMPQSVGIPVRGVKIRIVDAQTGAELPANRQGIVEVSSPCLMKGYYKAPSLTAERLRDGWLDTHDMGFIDDNGYLYILGRCDDMIIKAGMNIYPREIENVVNALPEIAECAAYGRKTTVGEEIALDVVLKGGNDTGKKQLLSKLSESLPAYLMPSYLNIVEAIPRSGSGKIIRAREV